MFFYLDSSAWVKRYVQERGSTWIQALFDRSERITSVSLGYVEVVAALSRRLPEKDLARIELRLTTDWQNMTRLHLTGEMIEQAAALARQYKLRGSDAVHLAATLGLKKISSEVNESIVFVASDHELLGAAQRAGVSVEDPLVATPGLRMTDYH